METENKFQALRKIDVGSHIEKKNGLSYLSWAYAVDELLQQDGTATWEYSEPLRFNDTLMVFCSVHAFGKTMTSQLPVMDYKNKAIANPDAMAVNTAMQRCLAKAIALHGIGLYIYAGEDLPEQDKEIQPEAVKASPAKKTHSATDGAMDRLQKADRTRAERLAVFIASQIAAGNEWSAYEAYSAETDADFRTATWSLLDSKTRSTLKAMKEEEAAHTTHHAKEAA